MFYSVETLNTIRKVLDQRLVNYPGKPMWAYQNNGDAQKIIKNSEEFMSDVESVGAFLINSGMKNKKIVILGENSYNWVVLFYAITCSGNTVVPMDYYLDADTISELLTFNGCDMVFYSSACSEKADEIKKKLPVPFRLIDEIDLIYNTKQNDEVLSLYRNAVIDPSDTAAIYFTSGSAGRRKGVELSQINIASEVISAANIMQPTERAYLILPFFHIFGILSLFYYMLGGCTYISRGIDFFTEEFINIKPTLLCTVPIMLQKFYDLYRILGTNMYAQIVCGAAPNQGEWIQRFSELNVDLYFGYGMTESASGIATSSRDHNRCDGSMKVLTCCEVKIDSPNSDGIGEILVKGSNVMKGYYKMPEETAEVLRDGWLYTGDLGILDKDNFLTVVGRKKNIIVLSNGENIAPEPLEDKLMKICGAAECIVCSRDGVLAAEIYAPNADEEEIKQKVKELNHVIPPYSRIVRVIMRKEPFPKNALGKIMRNDIN